MEISLQTFNLEEAINNQYKTHKNRREGVFKERGEAEQSALNIFAQQFKRELNTYLSTQLQDSLKIEIPVQKFSGLLGVYATFNYADKEFILKRNQEGWEILSNQEIVSVEPEFLQTTLLIELGRWKDEGLS